MQIFMYELLLHAILMHEIHDSVFYTCQESCLSGLCLSLDCLSVKKKSNLIIQCGNIFELNSRTTVTLRFFFTTAWSFSLSLSLAHTHKQSECERERHVHTYMHIHRYLLCVHARTHTQTHTIYIIISNPYLLLRVLLWALESSLAIVSWVSQSKLLPHHHLKESSSCCFSPPTEDN